MSKKILDELDLNCNLSDEYLTNITIMIKQTYNKKYSKDKIFNYICKKYNVNDKVQSIAKMEQFKQRSPEWFAQRKKLISASDMASVFDIGYSKHKQLLEKKVLDNSTFRGNKYTRWGQKYEDIASIIYESRTNKNVLEFGLIQHPKYSYIGASPDGITTDGIMLEIKCPSTREITGIPPEHYEIQMQIQLEVCELDVCDFCEIMVEEYDEEDYLEHDNGDLEKGVLICCRNYGEDDIYFYPKSFMLGNDKMLFEWRDKIIELNKNKYKIVKPCYWFIKKYSCVPVYRNKEWFNNNLYKITELWNKIIYYRDNLDEYNDTYKKKIKNKQLIKSIGTRKSSFHDEVYDYIDNNSNDNIQHIDLTIAKKHKIESDVKNIVKQYNKSSFYDEIYCNETNNDNIDKDIEDILNMKVDAEKENEKII